LVVGGRELVGRWEPRGGPFLGARQRIGLVPAGALSWGRSSAWLTAIAWCAGGVDMSPSVGRAPAAAAAQAAAAGRRRIVWFFGLAYALSWLWLVPIAAVGGRVAAGSGWPTHLPALLAPLAAALIVTARYDGRAGLNDLGRRMVRVRVPLRWWAFAVSPLLVLVLVLLVDVAAGRALPAIGDFARFSGVASGWGPLGVGAAIVMINGFGEETGWRGYAVPRLQRRYPPLTATMIVAALWAGWHLPMFFVVDGFRSFTLAITAGWVFGLFCGAIVLTWLYNHTRSILLVALWHGTYNIISGTGAATGLLAAVSTTLVMVLAVALVVLELRATRAGRRSVVGPPDAAAGDPGRRGGDDGGSLGLDGHRLRVAAPRPPLGAPTVWLRLNAPR